MEKYIIHLNAPRMSGRVVEFRILEQDEIDRLEGNAARSLGPDAERDELRREQLKLFTAAMIVRYTKERVAPNRVPAPKHLLKKGMNPDELYVEGGVPDPKAMAALKASDWVEADAVTLATSWSKVFRHKETEALRMLFTDHHELTQLEVMMLSGKAQPVPTGD